MREKIVGFHVDLKAAHYRRDYLERWLRELSALGYNAILWEPENAVQWETAPECSAPEAFSKEEFGEILSYSRMLGLEPIPLLQTFGHVEYVVSHPSHTHLSELPEVPYQYCPMNPAVVPFVHRWVEEYLEVFGDIRYFHIGADETWLLGKCERCAEYASKHSASALFVKHVNSVVESLLARGVTPAMWADMILTHNEALEQLSRSIMLFDWQYAVYHGDGQVYVWGENRKKGRETIPPDIVTKFRAHLYPMGDEPGREPNTFYTADFLAEKGFAVVTCPASASSGDNVFCPRNWLHMVNSCDSSRKGLSGSFAGVLLTSWSVRVHPWELQRQAIEIPPLIRCFPEKSLADLQRFVLRRRFGTEDPTFWRAVGLLAKSCLFCHSGSLGVDKNIPRLPQDFALVLIEKLRREAALEGELANCADRLVEYRQALAMLQAFGAGISKGRDVLQQWELAARNLVSRAEASMYLLAQAREAESLAVPAEDPRRSEGRRLLNCLRELREETTAMYGSMQKPLRTRIVVGWLYDAVEAALVHYVG